MLLILYPQYLGSILSESIFVFDVILNKSSDVKKNEIVCVFFHFPTDISEEKYAIFLCPKATFILNSNETFMDINN